MGKKQLSGAQKRKIYKARQLTGGSVMPPPPTAAALEGLRGVAREQNRNYRHWRAGRISHETYLVAVRGLSALTSAYNAVELEKRNLIDERLARSLEALEGGHAGVPVLAPASISTPAPGLLSPASTPAAALEGELLPRSSDDVGNELTPNGERELDK